MANVVKQRSGRSWSVDTGGISSLQREYIVIQDDVLAANGEVASFAGVPAIDSEHPSIEGLFVTGYDVKEGEGSDKKVLVVTVKYGPKSYESSGSGEEETSVQVDEWGWDDGSEERELVTGVDGTQVLNSAGDPFESVPKMTVPAPVFTKVMKFQSRQSGWQAVTCCVNSGNVTIGGISFLPCTLLCTVSERRVIGNPVWKYQYTVKLRYKSNLVKLAGSGSATEIGWDVAVVDAGMQEKDPTTGKKQLIRMVNKENGKLATVSSPALLNGSGAKLAENGTPYNIRFQAYSRANFPSWFYSEPTAQEEGLQG